MPDQILLIDHAYDYWRKRSADALSSKYSVTTIDSIDDVPANLNPYAGIIYSVDRVREQDYEPIRQLSYGYDTVYDRNAMPHYAVLVVSNHLTIDLFSDLHHLGALDMIERPYDMDNLVNWVDRNIKEFKLKTKRKDTGG